MSTANGAATGPPDLHVLIVGAGIAGLSAAISCREKGFRVTALESVAEFSHVGAGLGISSNGSRILRDMGVEEEVRRRGTVLKSVQFLRHGDGSVVKEQDFGDAEQRWGAPLWQIHRGDLHDVLLARARRAGVEIRMDARVDEYDPAGPGVLLADGSRIAADVMLCADGYRSPARAALLGAPSEPRPCGNAAYRALVDVKLLPDDPSLAPLLDHENEVSFSWLGPLRHVVGYTLRQGTLFNLVLTGPAMRTRAEAGKYVVTVDPKEVLEEYKDWDTRLLTILKQLPENTLEWNLCDLDPLESWVFGGKTVLMGDAAHPVLPSSGQGAVLAIEDGSAIAELLARTSDRAQIPSALKTFQKLRQPRAATTLQIGRADANKWHEKDTTKGGTSTPVLWGYNVKEAARSIDFV